MNYSTRNYSVYVTTRVASLLFQRKLINACSVLVAVRVIQRILQLGRSLRSVTVSQARILPSTITSDFISLLDTLAGPPYACIRL